MDQDKKRTYDSDDTEEEQEEEKLHQVSPVPKKMRSESAGSDELEEEERKEEDKTKEYGDMMAIDNNLRHRTRTQHGSNSAAELDKEAKEKEESGKKKCNTLYTLASPGDGNLTSPDDIDLPDILQLLALDLMSEDRNVVRAALKKIGDKSTKGGDDCTLIPPLMIVGAMLKWYTCHQIQAEACKALFGMVKSEDKKASVLHVGALEAVVLAMKNFPETEEVQFHGCCALVNLTSGNTENSLDHLATKIPHGLAVIVQAMKCFPAVKPLQHMACIFFDNMALTEELRILVIGSGALEALAAALKNHAGQEEDWGIPFYASRAMRKFLGTEELGLLN